MSNRLHARIPDEEVLNEFLSFLDDKYPDKKYVKGKELQKAIKLILTFYGCKKYKFDHEVEQLWDIYTGLDDSTHMKINMIKAVDDSHPRLRNQRERAYAMFYCLKNDHSSRFDFEDARKSASFIAGVSDKRPVRDYLDILKADDKIVESLKHPGNFGFAQYNDFNLTYGIISEQDKCELIELAKEEAML